MEFIQWRITRGLLDLWGLDNNNEQFFTIAQRQDTNKIKIKIKIKKKTNTVTTELHQFWGFDLKKENWHSDASEDLCLAP